MLRRLARVTLIVLSVCLAVGCGGAASDSRETPRVTATARPAPAETPVVSTSTPEPAPPTPSANGQVGQAGVSQSPKTPTQPSRPEPTSAAESAGDQPAPDRPLYLSDGNPCPRAPVIFMGGGGPGQTPMEAGEDRSGAILNTLQHHPGPVHYVAFGSGGSTIITVGDGSLYHWDSNSMAPLGEVAYGPERTVVALAEDGSLAALYDPSKQEVQVRQIDSGSLLLSIPGWQQFSQRAQLGEIAFSPGGRYIALTEDDEVTVWRLDGSQRQQRFKGSTDKFGLVRWGHAGDIHDLAFSPDAQVLATVSLDGTVRLWDLASGSHLRCFEVRPSGSTYLARGVDFSPDGRLLLAYDKDMVHVWDVSDPNPLQLFSHPRESERGWSIASANFSPDGQSLLTAGFDGTARIWDVESGSLLALMGHDGPLAWAGYSPDGNRILTLVGFSYLPDSRWSLWLWDAGHADLKIAAEAEDLVGQGVELILSDVTAGRQRFQHAQALYPFPYRDLEQYGLLYSAKALVDRGIELTLTGDSAAAKSAFELAYDVHPDPPPNLVATSAESAIRMLAYQVVEQARAGQIDDALASMTILDTLELDRALLGYAWDRLCRFGSLWSRAGDVADACATAGSLAEYPHQIASARDSRGINRVMLGDFEGALDDFRYVVETVELPIELYPTALSERQAWLVELAAGRNPLDAATIEALLLRPDY